MSERGRFVVVFDVGPHVLLMGEEEEFPERGKVYDTADEAIEALGDHMLASVALVLDLNASEF